jgi:hypothetical protein
MATGVACRTRRISLERARRESSGQVRDHRTQPWVIMPDSILAVQGRADLTHLKRATPQRALRRRQRYAFIAHCLSHFWDSRTPVTNMASQNPRRRPSPSPPNTTNAQRVSEEKRTFGTLPVITPKSPKAQWRRLGDFRRSASRRRSCRTGTARRSPFRTRGE